MAMVKVTVYSIHLKWQELAMPFSIQSGGILFTSTDKNGIHAIPLSSKYVGITVYTTILTDEVGILEKTLTFDNKKHNLTDYLELHYEMDVESNTYYYMFSKDKDSTESRIYGRALRNKFTNLLSSTEFEYIVLYFSEVSIISSSFADELIEILYQILGKNEFEKHYKIVNINPMISKVVDSSLSQREDINFL